MDLHDSGAHLAAGMALNLPGYPAIPPVPTTVSMTDTQHLLSYATAYHLTLAAFEARGRKQSNASTTFLVNTGQQPTRQRHGL